MPFACMPYTHRMLWSRTYQRRRRLRDLAHVLVRLHEPLDAVRQRVGLAGLACGAPWCDIGAGGISTLGVLGHDRSDDAVELG